MVYTLHHAPFFRCTNRLFWGRHDVQSLLKRIKRPDLAFWQNFQQFFKTTNNRHNRHRFEGHERNNRELRMSFYE